MAKTIYNETGSTTQFKTNVSETKNAPYYFEKSNVKFFGSKVNSVSRSSDRDNYLAKETLTTSPDGKNKYKVLAYDRKENELYSSKIYESKAERDEVYNKIKKGEYDAKDLRD